MRVRGLLMVGALVATLLPAAGVATAAEVTTACPRTVTPAGFSDVATTNVHADSIDCAVWWEMARGATQRRFRPNGSVTRAQMATFVAKLILRSGGSLPASPPDRFADDDHSPHHFNINRLARAGVVAGNDGRYRPDALVTRAQMATFLVRAYELRTGRRLAGGADAFRDDDASLHEANINKAAAAGFTSGTGDRSFSPDGEVLRGQMATFVTSTLDGVIATGMVRSSPATLRAASALTEFDECGALLGHLKERGLEEVGPYGWDGGFFAVGGGATEDSAGGGEGAAPPTSAGEERADADVDFSGTNNQEAGVDEADVVKTDGRLIVTVVGNRLRVVDVSSGTAQLRGVLTLGDTDGYELFLRGTKALVMATDWSYDGGPRPIDDTMTIAPEPGGSGGPATVLTLVDLADPSAPRIESVLRVDGWRVAARMVEGIARIVLRNDAPQLDFAYPEEGTEESAQRAAQHNRLVVESSTIADWLPRWRLEDRRGATPAVTEGALLGCQDLRHPPEYSGLGSINVMTVDLASALQPGQATGVLAGGETVYASTENLYVATTRWGHWVPEPVVETQVTTEVHKFSIADPTVATYSASGKVPGFLLNQFSMSERDGNLRVASTSQPMWWLDDGEESSSQVVVLAQSGESLTTIGQVGGLGRGEQIYAVRFIGDQGYVVTFRQTDPLYVLDMADPTAPRVTGELKILGYSAYLHPVGEGRLLGVGQDANEEGQTSGTQLSLFDVSDPAAPTRIAQSTLEEGTYSDVEWDHRAFLFWPATGTTVIPATRYRYDEQTQTEDVFVGAYGFDVDASSITKVGAVTHGAPATGDRDGESEAWPGIRRSLVVNGVLYTLSDRGLLGSDLETFAERSWTPFTG